MRKLTAKNILRQLLKQIFKMILLLFAVTFVAFLLVLASPNDPVDSFVSKGVTEEERAVIEERWGLDQPVLVRYGLWVKNVLRGDFGTSLVYSQPVRTVIASRISATLLMLGAAWIISGVMGFLLGILSGTHQGSIIDKIIKNLALILASAPVFWVGLLAIMLFSVKLGWLPMGLSAPAGKLASEVTIGDRIYHLILPAFTVGLTGISKITLHTREKMIDIMKSDFMLYAKARGESRGKAVRRHGIRNIILPAITLQFNSFNELFSGSVLAETVFTYPGLGNAATMAGLCGDANLLLAVTLISTIIVVAGNAVANLLYGVFDPEIREVEKNAE